MRSNRKLGKGWRNSGEKTVVNWRSDEDTKTKIFEKDQGISQTQRRMERRKRGGGSGKMFLNEMQQDQPIFGEKQTDDAKG